MGFQIFSSQIDVNPELMQYHMMIGANVQTSETSVTMKIYFSDRAVSDYTAKGTVLAESQAQVVRSFVF